jgi:hypothetical protein
MGQLAERGCVSGQSSYSCGLVRPRSSAACERFKSNGWLDAVISPVVLGRFRFWRGFHSPDPPFRMAPGSRRATAFNYGLCAPGSVPFFSDYKSSDSAQPCGVYSYRRLLH